MGNAGGRGCMGTLGSSKEEEDIKGKKIKKSPIFTSSAPIRTISNAPSSSSSYWDHVTDDSEGGGFSIEQFRTLAQRKGGIPDRYRPRLWSAVTRQARQRMQDTSDTPSLWEEQLYDQLKKMVATPSAALWEKFILIKNDTERTRLIKEQLLTPCEAALKQDQLVEWGRTMKQLHLDIPRNRLIVGNVTVQRMVALGVSASVHNPKAGYMQGMDALAATLLRHLDDRDAFWAFMLLCSDTLSGYFDDPGNHAAMTFELWVFQELLSDQLPNVNYVLTSTFNSLFVAMDTPLQYEGTTLTFPPIEISFNVFSWFVRCFAGHLPEEHTYHVWDLLLARLDGGQNARAVMHAAALSIFHRLGASIEEQGGDDYKSKSLKMETIKTIVKQFMSDGGGGGGDRGGTGNNQGKDSSVLLRSTEASDFHEDVQMYLAKLEDGGMYQKMVQRLKKIAQKRKEGMRH